MCCLKEAQISTNTLKYQEYTIYKYYYFNSHFKIYMRLLVVLVV